jgi:hypothetical protein
MIKEKVKQILAELPAGVELVAAAKQRTPQEISEAIEAGVKIVGENYVQEAEEAFKLIGKKARWHFIGHLQTNKVRKAIHLFDMIETVDSLKLAMEIDKRCQREEKVMPILIEINSGREAQKYGVLPEETEELIKQITPLKNVKIMGLMTMGPFAGDPEDARPYFVETRKIFEKLKQQNPPSVEMKYLSMGMSNSYKVAIEEGANMVRLGTVLFGPRQY